MANLKLNKSATFKTNEDLYYEFALKCKLNKQKIGDRLNALIAADVKISAPFCVVPEPVLFDNPGNPITPKEAANAENC